MLYFANLNDTNLSLRYVTYYNEHLARVWKWSAVQTKDVQTLIDKAMRIEGVLDQSAGVA